MKNVEFKKVLESIFVVVICTLILIPNSSYAKVINTVNEQNYNKIMEEDDRIIRDYIIMGEDNVLYFDVAKAIENGENKDIIEIGKLFNDFSYEMNQGGDNSYTTYGVPIWGNWCGPGYGSGVPIDLLDEGCKQHDSCYVHGGNNCECNKKLINYINRNISRMTGGQKLMARAVKAYFSAENALNGC